MNFILEQIVPGFHATRANKQVSEFYRDREHFDVDISAINSGEEREFIDQLKKDLENQHDRKKLIEDKSKSLLFIIAVSITAITFSLTYLTSIRFTVYQVTALILLGLSILCFIQGVIKALQVLNIRQFHVIQAEVEITEKSYKVLAKKSDADFLKELIKSKQQNDLINIQLSNFTFASFNLIRNGIILFAVFFATTMLGNYFSKKDESSDTHVIYKEIETTINDTTTLIIPYTFELKYDLENLKIDKEQKN